MAEPRAVVVHDAAQARRALRAAAAAGRPVLLLSPEGGSASLGAGYLQAVAAAAGTAEPDAVFQTMLDCGTAAGEALGALRAGWRLLRLNASPPVQARVTAIAAGFGATVVRLRPAALDLGDPSVPVEDAYLAGWLATAPSPEPG